jgi:hypothetical protein
MVTNLERTNHKGLPVALSFAMQPANVAKLPELLRAASPEMAKLSHDQVFALVYAHRVKALQRPLVTVKTSFVTIYR